MAAAIVAWVWLSASHPKGAADPSPVEREFQAAHGVALRFDARALEAMKSVTEGLVRAIADEVAATRRAPAAYGRSGAMQGARLDAAAGIALNAKA